MGQTLLSDQIEGAYATIRDDALIAAEDSWVRICVRSSLFYWRLLRSDLSDSIVIGVKLANPSDG